MNGRFWFLGLLVVLSAFTASAEELSGKVVSVSDGDTITILDPSKGQRKVRLAGIDAPERRQSFGELTRQSLSEQVAGKFVTVDWSKLDRYGRRVGKVLLDGQDVNLEQVRRGMAWHYKAYEQEQSAADRRLYAEAEDAARAARRGLWVENNPMPPWECRRERSQAGCR